LWRKVRNPSHSGTSLGSATSSSKPTRSRRTTSRPLILVPKTRSTRCDFYYFEMVGFYFIISDFVGYHLLGQARLPSGGSRYSGQAIRYGDARPVRMKFIFRFVLFSSWLIFFLTLISFRSSLILSSRFIVGTENLHLCGYGHDIAICRILGALLIFRLRL
jgi:hypothetical protein